MFSIDPARCFATVIHISTFPVHREVFIGIWPLSQLLNQGLVLPKRCEGCLDCCQDTAGHHI
jgi:hypothetical protein